MAKKNTTTASAIATIATASVQVGTREVVSVATARIELSLKQALEGIKAKQEEAAKATKSARKDLTAALEVQGKSLLASARIHADALVLISGGGLEVAESFGLEEEYDDEDRTEVVSRKVTSCLSLRSKGGDRYCRDEVNLVELTTPADTSVVTACASLERCQKVEEELQEQRNEINRKLVGIPSMERQFMARMAENVLGATEGGKAMLSQVDEAVKAMGFGDLPMLTAVK